MKEKKSVLAVSIAAGMGLLVLIVFVTLLGVQVTAASSKQCWRTFTMRRIITINLELVWERNNNGRIRER